MHYNYGLSVNEVITKTAGGNNDVLATVLISLISYIPQPEQPNIRLINTSCCLHWFSG